MLAGFLLALVASCTSDSGQDLAFHRGVNALDDSRAAVARRYFAEHLQEHPDGVESWRLAGDAWMSGTMRSPAQAVEHWQRYLELRPDDHGVIVRLVDTLLLHGDWQAAERWSERLDGSAAAQMVRATVFLESDPVRAREALEHASKLDPGHPGLDALAARFHYLDGNAEQARVHAERATAARPLDRQSTYLLTRLRRRLGDPSGADALLAIHDLVSRLAGVAGMARPAPAEALALLEDLAALVPADGLEFRMEKARLLVASDRRSEAKRHLAEMAEQPDLTASTRMELAGLADQVGDLAIAGRLLRAVLDAAALDAAAARAANAEPTARGGNRRRAHYGLALLAHREGDQELLATLVEEGLAAYPHSAGFWHLSGRVLLIHDDAATAADHFEKAVVLAPWRSDFRIDLANLWLTEGRLDRVRALLAEAPDDDPAVAHYRRQNGLDDLE